MTHLVMFDIDGTLLDSMGFDTRLYSQAVREHLGVELDTSWSSYRHVTDSGVLDEVLEQSGSTDARLAEQVRGRFIELVREYLNDVDDAVQEIPGARSLLERLARVPQIRLAIATGGWRETAQLKLAKAGIDTRDIPLATSSEAKARVEIMKLAEARASEQGPIDRRTYFGDGAWDQRACSDLGYSFIAVGDEVEHPIQFGDLRDQVGILSALGIA